MGICLQNYAASLQSGYQPHQIMWRWMMDFFEMACNAPKEYGLTQQALERWYKQGKRETIMHRSKLM